MFVKRDLRKVHEIVGEDSRGSKKLISLKLGRRGPEFRPGNLRCLCRESFVKHFADLEYLSLYGNELKNVRNIGKTFKGSQSLKVLVLGNNQLGEAGEAAGELYGYGHSKVLFKPTKAAEFPFRPTAGEAMSYFVGGGAVDGGYSEDAGFAINGGKGWSEVVFTNHDIDLNGPVAIAMGDYVFTCATTGDEVKVEYTFGYKRNEDGNARIFLHHSSVPYSE